MQKKILKVLIGALALGLVIGAVLIYQGLTAPAFLKPRFEKRLSKQLQAAVQIKGLDFGLWSGARIEKLEIIPSPGDRKAGPEMWIRLFDVHVRHRLLPLLWGRYQTWRMSMQNVEAALAEGLQAWLAGIQKGRPEGALLEIAVADGTVRFSHAALDQPVIFKDIHFTLRPGGGGRGSRTRLNLDFKGNTLKVRLAEHAAESRWEAWFSAGGFDFSALPAVSLGEKSRLPAGLALKGDLAGRASIQMPEDTGEAPQLTGEMRISGISAS